MSGQSNSSATLFSRKKRSAPFRQIARWTSDLAKTYFPKRFSLLTKLAETLSLGYQRNIWSKSWSSARNETFAQTSPLCVRCVGLMPRPYRNGRIKTPYRAVVSVHSRTHLCRTGHTAHNSYLHDSLAAPRAANCNNRPC